MTSGICRHFNDSRKNDACAAGIAYVTITAEMERENRLASPCLGEVDSCPSYAALTAADLAARQAELRELDAQIPAAELAFLEGMLWAIAGAAEAEFDSGRWQKTVHTYDGPATFTLSLPDLLNPPSYEEWMARGFEPDRRANERVFADIDRYFAAHPVQDPDEMNAVLQTKFSGYRAGELVMPPEHDLFR